jgi:hypothetical protein
MKVQIFAVFALFSVVISSCSEDSICECIRASDQLNSKYDQLRTEKLSVKGQKEVKELLQTKKAKCKEFEQMSGPEMMERKASCK